MRRFSWIICVGSKKSKGSLKGKGGGKKVGQGNVTVEAEGENGDLKMLLCWL